MNSHRKLSQAEKAQRYDAIVEKQRAYYARNAEARKLYQRKRHAEMQAALNRERGRK